MPRLWIMSDLHLETDDGAAFVPPSDVDHDVVVLAGDVAWSQAASVEWADATFRQPVIYVSGNHEFWGGYGLEHRLHAGIDKASATEGRVRMLENTSSVVAGVRFLGCTLWTDFELDGTTGGARLWAMRAAATETPDYGRIHEISPLHISGVHARSRAWFEGELSKPFDGPTVVVTHHAPSGRSIGSDWAGATTSPAYASNLESVIERFQPALWIHGHVHEPFDYRIGRTRVVCNPKGFGSEGGGFDPRMVIEV